MKRIFAGLMLGALLTTAAQADTSIATTGVKVDYVNGSNPSSWDIQLLGEAPNGSAIGLNTLMSDLSNRPALDASGDIVTNGNDHWSVLRVDTLAGYRVTGIRLSGAMQGYLQVGEVAGSVGSADNAMFIGWSVGGPSVTLQPPPIFREQFTGEQAFDSSVESVQFGDVFYLVFNANVWNEARGAVAGGQSSMSIAAADLSYAVLNIHVSPVPEPGTWAMLLAGLGIVALARRRA